jgi:hypothetical protein
MDRVSPDKKPPWGGFFYWSGNSTAALAALRHPRQKQIPRQERLGKQL